VCMQLTGWIGGTFLYFLLFGHLALVPVHYPCHRILSGDFLLFFNPFS
jgi:hypothetical protein